MASITKLTDKPRTLPWRAKVKDKVRMFATKDEAQLWASEYERTLRMTGLPPTIEELRKHSVKEIVQRYLAEKTPLKGCAVNETVVLTRFLRRDICALSLAAIEKKHAYEYVAQRLKEKWRGKPITPRTVRREVNSIAHIFQTAKEEWGFENLNNPFRIAIKGSMHRRKRRILPGELKKLEQACQHCLGLNRYYVPLAIYLAIETGMREQEIFNLTWADVDLEKRRIEIIKSKTDHVSEYAGRTIVLPFHALTMLAKLRLAQLSRLKIILLRTAALKPVRTAAPDLDGRIFPMTKHAFQQAFYDARERAKIGADRRGERLTFHDIRREANTTFEAAGLTAGERNLMMGHADASIDATYIAPSLQSIQDKLDRQALGGMTFAEASQAAKAQGLDRMPKDKFYKVLNRVATSIEMGTKLSWDEAMRQEGLTNNDPVNVIEFPAREIRL